MLCKKSITFINKLFSVFIFVCVFHCLKERLATEYGFEYKNIQLYDALRNNADQLKDEILVASLQQQPTDPIQLYLSLNIIGNPVMEVLCGFQDQDQKQSS